MRENDIDNMGYSDEALVAALEVFSRHLLENSTISKVDLGGNMIGDVGGQVLLQMHGQRKEKGKGDAQGAA
jgi:hypothetical protein